MRKRAVQKKRGKEEEDARMWEGKKEKTKADCWDKRRRRRRRKRRSEEKEGEGATMV